MCAGTLARPSLEGTLRLVLGAGGRTNRRPQAWGQLEGPRHNPAAPGRAELSGLRQESQSPPFARPPLQTAAVSNTCVSSSQLESVRPC